MKLSRIAGRVETVVQLNLLDSVHTTEVDLPHGEQLARCLAHYLNVERCGERSRLMNDAVNTVDGEHVVGGRSKATLQRSATVDQNGVGGTAEGDVCPRVADDYKLGEREHGGVGRKQLRNGHDLTALGGRSRGWSCCPGRRMGLGGCVRLGGGVGRGCRLDRRTLAIAITIVITIVAITVTVTVTIVANTVTIMINVVAREVPGNIIPVAITKMTR